MGSSLLPPHSPLDDPCCLVAATTFKDATMHLVKYMRIALQVHPTTFLSSESIGKRNKPLILSRELAIVLSSVGEREAIA